MNGRSGSMKYFVFFLLTVIILLQFLSFIQANRLNERLDRFLEIRKTIKTVEHTQNI